MITNTFRPWGLLHWVLSKTKSRKWSILGSISTEERCLASLQEVLIRDEINYLNFLMINDPPSHYTPTITELTQKQRKLYLTLVGDDQGIVNHDLFDGNNKIVETTKHFIGAAGDNIIIDISSLPKRYFFPIIKLVLRSEAKNIIVTYTVPTEYCPDGGDLAEDPQAWNSLPLFSQSGSPDAKSDVMIIGIGYLPFNLPELLETQYKDIAIKLIFPFPPGPPSYQLNLSFIKEIESSLGSSNSNLQKIERVHTYDVSEIFNQICKATSNGVKSAIFAPYGPKTISLAMAVYATYTNSAVYYTQPRVYNPKYSVGVKMIEGKPETYSYCLRLAGTNLYTFERQAH